MRFCPKPVARTLGAIAFTTTLLFSTAGAEAASPARSVQYDVPSNGNVDIKKVQLNGADKLTAWVRLPAGYDEQPDRRWPVLYLLHGWEDNAGGWLDPKKGDLNATLPADFPGIVVMPEGGKEWFVNWADDKANPGRKWGDYLYDEVVPFMEKTLRIAPGRSNHAIGGLSMGGYGALRATAAFPTYFGHALSFSGLVDTQDVSFSGIVTIAQIGRPGYSSIFGSLLGPYAETTNPIKTARDFALSRITVNYGTPSISTLWALDLRVRAIATLEIGAQLEARRFLDALKGTGAYVYSENRANGSHDWKWWKQDLTEAAARGIFTAPPVTETSQATSWAYDTMSVHGNAWGLGYKMVTKPTKKMELIRRGSQLTGKGSGIVIISGGARDTDASGNGTRADCTYVLNLPFTQQLPAGC